MAIIQYFPMTTREKVNTYLWDVYYLSGDFNIHQERSCNLYFLVCTKQLFVASDRCASWQIK